MIGRIRKLWARRKKPKIYNVFIDRKQTLDEYLEWKRRRQQSPEAPDKADASKGSEKT